jgi:CIC family chloride channel protein
VIGGFLLMPIAWLSPQALSAGHGALHLNLLLHPPIMFLLTVLALKIAASVISLSFGFRGGFSSPRCSSVHWSGRFLPGWATCCFPAWRSIPTMRHWWAWPHSACPWWVVR